MIRSGGRSPAREDGLVLDDSRSVPVDVDQDGVSSRAERRINRLTVLASVALGAVAGGVVGALLTVRSATSAAAILEALGGFAWPLIAVLALWIFREPLSKMLGRMRSGEVGPQGLKFTAGEDLVAQAGRAVGEESTEAATSSSGPTTGGTDLTLLAATDPTTAVNQAWRRVRGAVKDLAVRVGVAEGTHGTPPEAASYVAAAQLIESELNSLRPRSQ